MPRNTRPQARAGPECPHFNMRTELPLVCESHAPQPTLNIGMRLLVTLAAVVCLTACSDTPAETKVKEPEKPLAPITGRQAFQSTYAAARAWAADCQPVRIRSINLPEVPPEDGKAGAWEILYASASRSAGKVYTWSAMEALGLHQGVFAGPQQSWTPVGQERPFLPAALKTDTPEALKIAKQEGSKYLKKPGKKPEVTYLLELTPRFPDLTWRVLWGVSVGAAEYSIFVDATTGAALGGG